MDMVLWRNCTASCLNEKITSHLASETLQQLWSETAAGHWHRDRKEMSIRSLEEESPGRQVVCAAWCGQGGVDRLTQTECTSFFSFVAVVACTPCCVVCCSQKMWRMADKTGLCRHVHCPWSSAAGQPLRTWRNGADWPHTIQAGSTSDAPQRQT